MEWSFEIPQSSNMIALGSSADGRFLVGSADDPAAGTRGIIRIEANAGIENIGLLSGLHPDDASSPRASGIDISTDGSVIVGYSTTDAGVEAVIWTEDAGLRNIGSLYPNPDRFTATLAIAYDDSDGAVHGFAGRDEVATLFRWTEDEGMVDILPASSYSSLNFFRSSAGGSAMPGFFDAGSKPGFTDLLPLVWSRENGVVEIPLPPNMTVGIADACSDDGNIIVGVAGDDLVLDQVFIWTPEQGSHLLTDFAREFLRVSFGEWLPAGWFNVSGDGSNIAGIASRTDSDGSIQNSTAFVLDITPPCDGDWDVDGRLNFFDIYGYLTDYNTEHLAADLDRDGDVETEDLFRFIDAFVGGCP